MKKYFSILSALTLILTAASGAGAADAPKQTKLINGAGATFPYPIYSKWFSEYNKKHPSIEINYQSVGSGAGIKQLVAKTVDFGASDAPMSDEELKAAPGAIVHVPTVLGSVAITYNLPGIKTSIKMSPEVLSGIFMGTIRKWNDAKIAALNPGVAFPDKTIAVAYRADSSGTTAVFTEYLKKVSPEWSQKVGAGKAVKWPVGTGSKGNEGVTGFIKTTEGAIGYVELVYALSEKMPVAEMKNKAGKFVAPSLKSTSEAAAASVKAMPADFRVSITDADGAGSYPISAFTYLLVYKTMDKDKGGELVKFLDWAMADGQKIASDMNYAPLPKDMLAKVKTTVKGIELK